MRSLRRSVTAVTLLAAGAALAVPAAASAATHGKAMRSCGDVEDTTAVLVTPNVNCETARKLVTRWDVRLGHLKRGSFTANGFKCRIVSHDVASGIKGVCTRGANKIDTISRATSDAPTRHFEVWNRGTAPVKLVSVTNPGGIQGDPHIGTVLNLFQSQGFELYYNSIQNIVEATYEEVDDPSVRYTAKMGVGWLGIPNTVCEAVNGSCEPAPIPIWYWTDPADFINLGTF